VRSEQVDVSRAAASDVRGAASALAHSSTGIADPLRCCFRAATRAAASGGP
jgi:hypothetical protein